MSNIIIKNGEITSSDNINLYGTELIFGNNTDNNFFNFRNISDDIFNITGSINYKNVNTLNDYFFIFKNKTFDDFTSSKNDNFGVGGTHVNTYTSGTLFYSESIGLNFINTNSSSIKLGGILLATYKGSTLQNFKNTSVNLITGSYDYTFYPDNYSITSSKFAYTGMSQSIEGNNTGGYYLWKNTSFANATYNVTHSSIGVESNTLFLTQSSLNNPYQEIISNVGNKIYSIDSIKFNVLSRVHNNNTEFYFTKLKIEDYKNPTNFYTNENIVTISANYSPPNLSNYGNSIGILYTSSFNKDLNIIENLGYLNSMSVSLKVKATAFAVGTNIILKLLSIGKIDEIHNNQYFEIYYTVYNDNIPFVPVSFFGNDKIYNPLEFFKNVNMLKFKVNGNIYIKKFTDTIAETELLFNLSSSFIIKKYDINNNEIIENISYFVEDKKGIEFDSGYSNEFPGGYPFMLEDGSINKNITESFSDYYNYNKIPYNIEFILLNKGISGNSINFFTKGYFYHNFSNILANIDDFYIGSNRSKGTWYQSSSSFSDMTNINYIKFDFNLITKNVSSKIPNMNITTDNVIIETY